MKLDYDTRTAQQDLRGLVHAALALAVGLNEDLLRDAQMIEQTHPFNPIAQAMRRDAGYLAGAADMLGGVSEKLRDMYPTFEESESDPDEGYDVINDDR